MIKILFLAANPSDSSRLRLDAEIRAIDESLSKAKFRDEFEIVQHWAVRTTDIQSHLLRHNPQIVHFSGHGSETNEILLEDQHGDSKPVPVPALKQLFSILKGSVRCVVLNACYSEAQARAIAEDVLCVVGMSRAIRDTSAVNFAAAFYQALGYGRDLQSAYQLGCVQIALESLDDEDAPQLIALSNDPSKIRLAEPKAEARSSAASESFDRTGIEIYCKKPWSGLGAHPRCTITMKNSGFSTKRKLMWEAFVFIPLEAKRGYSLAIKRPSDFVSFQAKVDFNLALGEVRRYVYESPAISFMAGEIKPFREDEMAPRS